MTSSTLFSDPARLPILGDGAMGTLLMSGGGTWLAPEQLNLEAPARVTAAHAAYVAAGAELVETNSFGGSPAKLEMIGLGDRAREVNVLAARLARRAAGTIALVAGSIGPTGRLLEPLGDLSEADAEAGFALQAGALAEGGADLIVIETMTDITEAAAAVRGALGGCTLPIVCTMSFEPNGRTVMGASLADLLSLLEIGATAVGVNCGYGPEVVGPLLQRLRALSPEASLAAQPNAGSPRLDGGQAVYDVTPAELADFALEMKRLGLVYVGACCGSTPAHIEAMSRALEKAAR
jgi:5-methyltetrahydrofolate--homocysteine methyltransferase